MNVSLESRLFTLDQPLGRDVTTMRHTNQGGSNRVLYQTYHMGEVHAVGYPNFDDKQWDNRTKNLYNTKDRRNLWFPPAL